jgi:hypothetical protein
VLPQLQKNKTKQNKQNPNLYAPFRVVILSACDCRVCPDQLDNLRAEGRHQPLLRVEFSTMDAPLVVNLNEVKGQFGTEIKQESMDDMRVALRGADFFFMPVFYLPISSPPHFVSHVRFVPLRFSSGWLWALVFSLFSKKRLRCVEDDVISTQLIAASP